MSKIWESRRCGVMQWEIWVDGHKTGFSVRCIDMWGIKMVMI